MLFREDGVQQIKSSYATYGLRNKRKDDEEEKEKG